MSNHDSTRLEERFFLFERQKVTVHDFESVGYILDIGGGGEGIIGILKGEKVIAIDPQKRELEEAADGPLKIIMDARDLQFLDGTFNTVTAFFSLMYLTSKPDYEAVFSQVFRVLKPGGQFLIWDVSVPQRPEGEKRNYVLLVTITVKDRVVDTGYGQPWPEEEHDLAFYVDLAEKSGFQMMERREDGQTFFLRLQKP
jgi:ubiquinone/menaquinone biosynthesis C-methylase UbiE